MSRKMCPKIILEGTRLTFKTEIAFALNQHPRVVGPRQYRYHSPIVSAEWCALTNFPWGRGLINFQPDEQDKALETYETWVRLFELQRYYSWIVDRFHLSTKAFQSVHNGVELDFSGLEERLTAIGFGVVYMRRSSESFAQARTRRLVVSGNPSQYDDLELFVQEQEVFDQLIKGTRLPVLTLDISDNDTDLAVEQIADWLHDTGRIWADY